MIKKLLQPFAGFTMINSKQLCKLGILNLALLGSYNASAQHCNYTEWDAGVEYISNVTFAGINNTTSNVSGLAQDFTSLAPAVVNKGTSYTISVSMIVDEYDSIDAFIDWNQNGVFNDAGEVYTIIEDGMEDGAYTSTITPPATALTGTTKMRLMVVYDRSFEGTDPCGSYWEYGEVEDYAVSVLPSLGTTTFDKSALSVYPNPVKNNLNISYESEISEVKIYNLLGQEVFSKATADSNLKLDISNITSGNYVVKLFGPEGQYNFKLIKQ